MSGCSLFGITFVTLGAFVAACVEAPDDATSEGRSESVVSAITGTASAGRSFQALSLNQVVVLGSDGNLWIENGPFARTVPPPRLQVDGNVASFQALSTSDIFVLGSNGNLWLEHPNGAVPPPRTQVDGNVAAFQALSASVVFVLGTDGKLWREIGRAHV